MRDLYERFAADYDRFGTPEQYIGREAGFFERLFEFYGTESVLDCSCGTGRHLFLFHQLGLDVAGSDLSPAMLERAERYLRSKDMRPALAQCDFRYLERCFDRRFDAVVCLSTSLPHLHTDDDLLRALRSMRDRLKSGGILVLTQGTTHKNLHDLPPIEVVVNDRDFSRIFVKELQTENDMDFLDIHILDLHHDYGSCTHNQYDMRYRLLLDDDYRRLLGEAGFSSVSVVGDYDMTPYNPDTSARMLVVAER